MDNKTGDKSSHVKTELPFGTAITVSFGSCLAALEQAPPAKLQLPCCILILHLTELMSWSPDVAFRENVPPLKEVL